MDRTISKAELISKFKDGEKRYHESALFHRVIDAILYGGDELKIIDQLIEINDSTIKELRNYVQSISTPGMFYRKNNE